MNNRSTLELLKLLLSNVDILTSGLCNLAEQLYDNGIINVQEAVNIQQYIESQRPAGYPQYSYWWNRGMITPRKNWLIKQIELLENGE